MATALQMAWSESSLLPRVQDRQMTKLVQQQLGFVPSVITYLTALPWAVSGATAAFAYLHHHTAHLPAHLGPMITLIAGQETSCRYCYGSSRAYMKLLGYREDYIRDLERGLYGSDLNEGEKRTLAFVRQVIRLNPLPAAGDLTALEQAGMSAAAVREAVVSAG